MKRPSPLRCALREEGFSVIEALIAAALLLIITIGILPFFTRSILNNAEGARSTTTTNYARSKIEELYQLPFDSGLLTVPPGATELETIEYYSARQKRWLNAPPTNEPTTFTRSIRVRQFNISALEDNGRFDDGEALAGGVTPSFLHLKEIEIEVRTPDQVGALGTGKRVRLRTYKPF